MAQPGRLIGKISSFVAAGAFFVLAIGVGFIEVRQRLRFARRHRRCGQRRLWRQNVYNSSAAAAAAAS
jgi:hypothetical protein